MIVMATMWLRIAGPMRLNRQPARKSGKEFSTLQDGRNIQLGMLHDVASALEEIESEDVVHGARDLTCLVREMKCFAHAPVILVDSGQRFPPQVEGR